MPSRTRALLLPAALVVGACGSSGDSAGGTPAAVAPGRPVVVVTYSILADVVRQVVGDAATVEVIVPDGQDPHEYAASAHDVEAMGHAALVVANGLDLEEGLVEAIEQVERDGVAVLHAADHVTVRRLAGDDGDQPDDDDDGGHDGNHDHDGGDPHLWTDPLTMAELAPALGDALADALGVDLSAQVAAVQAEMTALDAEVRDILSAIPPGRCVLVTGHDSLGYFADRYGCEVIGAVIPSLSSTAEASARDLADLLDVAEAAGVGAVFTEVGTPQQVAEQVADEVGVPLLELPSHDLPDAGGYRAYIVDLATRIADGLGTAG